MKILVLALSVLFSTAAHAANFLDFQDDFLLARDSAVVSGSSDLCGKFTTPPLNTSPVDRIVLSCKNADTENCMMALNQGKDLKVFNWLQAKNETYEDGSTYVLKNVYSSTSAESQSLFVDKNGRGFSESYKFSSENYITLTYHAQRSEKNVLIGECTFTVPLKKNLGPALISAIKAGEVADVQTLLASGADANYHDYENLGRSVVEYAVAAKSLELLKILQNAGASLPSVLLSRAVDAGAMDIFDYLMQQPFTEFDYYSNLSAPIKRGNLVALKALVKAGAKPGQGHLHIAVTAKQIEILKYLLSLNVPVQGYTSALFPAAENNCDQCATLLIQAGANADFVHRDLSTPLILAAANGSDLVANILIKAGAGVDRSDSEYNRALSYAAMYRQSALTVILTAAGAEPNFLSQAKMSPLMTAASSGDRSSVEALLKAGADACMKGRDNFTAAQMAYVSGFSEIASLINKSKTCQ